MLQVDLNGMKTFRTAASVFRILSVLFSFQMSCVTIAVESGSDDVAAPVPDPEGHYLIYVASFARVSNIAVLIDRRRFR